MSTATAVSSLPATSASAESQTVAERVHEGGKFLTFFLADEEYGLEILKVQEIIGMMSVTPVPRTPNYMRGVINLRGKVIPIVALRLKFGMPSIDQTEETCIIVVQTRGMQVGIIVDKVSEVLDINGDDIEEPPALGCEVSTDFILGIGKTEDRIKLLLDIDRVLAETDMEAIGDAVAMQHAAGGDGSVSDDSTAAGRSDLS